MVKSFFEIFKKPKPIIAMIHLKPLPGSHLYRGGGLKPIIDSALADAQELQEGGIDGLLIENHSDIPFQKQGADQHTVAAMTLITEAIGRQLRLPFGVHILRNAPFAAIAVTHVTGGHFIRYNFMIDAYVTDQGVIEGNAYDVQKYRRELDTEVLVLCDVHSKYASPLGTRTIEESTRDLVYRALADGVIVTGSETGSPPDEDLIRRVKKSAGELPVIIGSGLTPDNVDPLLRIADGAIVGTSLKLDSKTTNPVDRNRVNQLLDAVNKLR